jgi:hypothetical protein
LALSNLTPLYSCSLSLTESAKPIYNDTEVQKDWLDHMLAVFEREERVGIVGAKLFYPDGRLQEADGLIWRAASGLNFGRDDDPQKPEYNYVRERIISQVRVLPLKRPCSTNLTALMSFSIPPITKIRIWHSRCVKEATKFCISLRFA